MSSLRGPKAKLIAALIAVVVLITGIYLNFFHSKGFVKTTATIVDVEWDYGAGDENDTLTPTVEYMVNGQIYTGKLDQSGSSYRIGQTITVLYNPEDPTIVHGSSAIGIYFMAASGVILVFIVISGIMEKRR